MNPTKRAAQVFIGLITAATFQLASAGVITSAASVTATNSHPNAIFGNPINIINQGGLQSGYTSGVTDFNTYIGSNPQHTILSAGAEWFTNGGFTSALLTFDLGSALLIDGVATWVDEFWGAGTISVSTSLDNISYAAAGSFNPTDWATNVGSYGADVFAFGATSAQYVQLMLSGCPQPLSQSGGGCGMGEVAFSATTSAPVPEPSLLGLLGLGLIGLGLRRRRLTS